MGAWIFLAFAFGLIVLGLMWQAWTPLAYQLKSDDRYANVAKYDPDFLVIRDALYTMFQYGPLVIGVFCGLVGIIKLSRQETG